MNRIMAGINSMDLDN